MSLLRPMMRTRILNASDPLSRQLRAVSAATPVSKPVAERITHNPALHCATCPFATCERVYLKAPLTGRGRHVQSEDKLVEALEKYYLIRAANTPTDYSGADSEQNYNARTQSLDAHRRAKVDMMKNSIIKQLALQQNTIERKAQQQIVQSLVKNNIDMLEGVRGRLREQAQRQERREKGRQKKKQGENKSYQRELLGTTLGVLLGQGVALAAIGIYYLIEPRRSEETEVGCDMDVD
ncbi:hypothetical protein J4E91_003041 [Alternaria rosae]|nr:hypothetical protein J4E91_003041 [Alternaria rosae]